MNKAMTTQQAESLAPYEKYFGMVLRASYCTYPGEQALQKMRDVWAEITGSHYPFRAGCPECIMNLVRDLGVLYYAATGRKPEDSAPSRNVKVGASSPAVPAPKPAEANQAPKKANSPAKKKPAPKSTKTAKK